MERALGSSPCVTHFQCLLLNVRIGSGEKLHDKKVASQETTGQKGKCCITPDFNVTLRFSEGQNAAGGGKRCALH